MLEEISGQVRRPLLILLGAVGLVLFVACANVANLFLSRAVARQREMGVRVALGASRHRLFQMLLVESLLLALFSGAVGLLIANWMLRAVPAVLTASLPGVSEVSLDIRVVSFTMGLSVVTALFFGLVPMIAGMKRELTDALREGARSAGGRRQHRLQGGLVVASVALAFVLLVASGLLIRSFNRLMNAESGVNALNVLSVEVSLPYAGYNQAPRVRSFYQTVQERITAIPGVKSGVVTTDLPLRADGERRAFFPEGTDPSGGLPPSIALTWAHGDYFTTFGIPLIRGRNFTTEEQMENRLVVVVSKNLADRYWPGEDPIGKRLKWGTRGLAGAVANGGRRGRRRGGWAARQRSGDSRLLAVFGDERSGAGEPDRRLVAQYESRGQRRSGRGLAHHVGACGDCRGRSRARDRERDDDERSGARFVGAAALQRHRVDGVRRRCAAARGHRAVRRAGVWRGPAHARDRRSRGARRRPLWKWWA